MTIEAVFSPMGIVFLTQLLNLSNNYVEIIMNLW